MKHRALGIIYIHSPHNIAVERSGKEMEIKEYKNGGKYVRDGKYRISFGKIPKLTDDEINRFAEVFC